MLIEEILNEREFGNIDKATQFGKNVGNKIAGVFSKKAYNKAISGRARSQGLRNANKISDKYTQWVSAKYPDQDVNYLNSSQFKEFMSTSQVLKGQAAAGFPMFDALPSVQTAFKGNEPVNFDDKTKQEIFLTIAMQQQAGQTASTGTAGAGNQVSGASTDPQDLQLITKALSKMNDAQKAALVNMATQDLQQ